MSRSPASILLLLLSTASIRGADQAGVRALETQPVGAATYFRIELDRPAKLALPDLDTTTGYAACRRACQVPRLLANGNEALWQTRPGVLSFIGKLQGAGKPERWLLSYPIQSGRQVGLAAVVGDRERSTAEVPLDWAQAVVLKPRPGKRVAHIAPARTDLEGQWAAAQVKQLAAFEAISPEFGFFTLARRTLGERYNVLSPAPLTAASLNEKWAAGLYELTTGAEAITQSLALKRAGKDSPIDRGRRSTPLTAIAGVAVPSHPWERMMAGKKPAPEPLADLVPEDNYYLTVKNVRGFCTAVDLIEQWGGNITRGFVLHDRDHGVRTRYERQLCLPSDQLARVLTPEILRGIALTGHDLYLQDGSDLTVLLDAVDPKKVMPALDRFIEAARASHKDLKESTTRYRNLQIDSFVTPHREVSLHRAALGKVVACSNSREALYRVIDRHAGHGKALADALDFKYMRTVFVKDDRNEDGFAFLSDAFVRRLVGPGCRIGAKRRLEARSALTLASHAALLGGWTTGKLPRNHQGMLDAAGLMSAALEVPEGKPVVWDGERGQATSEVYNTLGFTTPLVELPCDLVTEQEKKDYAEFRRGYDRLWGRFFDPVGIRFQLGEDRARVETYILPLVSTSLYNDLRGTATHLTRDDPSRFPLSVLGRFSLAFGAREWLSLHIDGDEAVARKLVHAWIRTDLNPRIGRAESDRLIWQIPLVLTVQSEKPETTSQTFTWLWQHGLAAPKTKIIERKYRGVTLREAPIAASRYRPLRKMLEAFAQDMEENASLFLALLLMLPEKEAPKAFHAAIVGNKYLLSWNEQAVKRQVDALLARKKGKPMGEEVNASLHLAAGNKTASALSGWLEWQTHRGALGSTAVWEALRRAGLDLGKRDEVRNLLGYAPMSPDGSMFEIDKRSGEVRNSRHGSLAGPITHEAPAASSPIARLLQQMGRIGVQMRFREDGVQTVLTFQRDR